MAHLALAGGPRQRRTIQAHPGELAGREVATPQPTSVSGPRRGIPMT
jgi:hypothetical protein